jgi:Flp pilus assembly pilin Flp
MSENDVPRRAERGAATIEYVMVLGFVTALVLFLLGLLFPSAGKDFETMVNQWGDKLATQIAGDEISPSSDAWGAK